MALSTVTAASLLAQLRYRLREASASVWTDAELYTYLDIAQYEIALKLNGISDIWYGSYVQKTSSDCTNENQYTKVDISSIYYARVNRIIYFSNDAGTYRVLPIVDIGKLEGYIRNQFFGTTKLICAIWGQSVYISKASAIGASDKLNIYYYRQPTAMAGSNPMDVPKEFQDLVIMFALAKAIEKINQIDRKNRIEEEIKAKLDEIKQAYHQSSNDIITSVKARK